MASLTGINHPNYSLNLSLHHRPSFTKPISSFSFKTPSRATKSILRASASSSSSSSVPPSPNPETHNKNPLLETPKPVSFLIKSSCVAIFTAALFFARFNQSSIAAPINKPTVQSVETTEDEKTEKPMKTEDELKYEISVLRRLMKAKLQAKRYDEMVPILDRMIEIQPLEKLWPSLRDNLLRHRETFELLKLGYEKILEIDPLFIKAYDDLILLASTEEDSTFSLKIYEEVRKRIVNAMKICERNEDVREFKMLLAQLRFFEEKYTDALKIYQELMKEDPKDSRPYLGQGFIYSILEEKDEADRQFEMYRRLVPVEDDFILEQNIFSAKAFSQREENVSISLLLRTGERNQK